MSLANEPVNSGLRANDWTDREFAPNCVTEWSPLGGITLRQHFAGLAMQGAIGNPDMIPTKETMPEHAKGWVAAADALIKELEEKK